MTCFKNGLCAAFLALLAVFAAIPARAADRTVVVVLFDGFSPAMMDAAQPMPNFNTIKREGAWSRHLVPVFPSLSLPNHTSFATGCWPVHHGVESNTFYDPKFGLFGHYAHPNEQDADWHKGCESMWEAAQRQHVNAAVYNWAGRWSGTRGPLAAFTNPLTSFAHRKSDDWVIAQGIEMLHDRNPDHPRVSAACICFIYSEQSAKEQDGVRDVRNRSHRTERTGHAVEDCLEGLLKEKHRFSST